MENIAGYVYDHTRCDVRRWLQLTADQQGPYFVSMTYSPTVTSFLRLARLHTETHPCCDPLDGRVHSLKDVTRWIGIQGLALRFISLGVMLGVFEMIHPWMRRDQESREDMIKRLERTGDADFRLRVKQIPSISSTNAKVVSRFGGATTRLPMFFKSSSEPGRAALPMASSSTSSLMKHLSLNASRLNYRGAYRGRSIGLDSRV